MEHRVLDIEQLAHRFDTFISFSISKLDLESMQMKTKIDNINGTMNFKDWLEFHKDIENINYNPIKIIDGLIDGVESIRDTMAKTKRNMTEEIKLIIQGVQGIHMELDKMKEAYAEILEELELKEKQNIDLHKKLVRVEQDSMQNQINNLYMIVNSFKENKPIPHELLGGTEIIENVADENKVEIHKPIKDGKELRMQEAHEEVLVECDKNGLCPLHKVDIVEASSIYKNIWRFVAPKHSLTEDDLPEFVDKLELYEQEDDNYLDKLQNVEKR